MALVKCKECGNQISSKASACPTCGAKPSKKVGVLGWLFVIFIVLPVAWQIGSGMNEVDRSIQSSANPGGSSSASQEVTPLNAWSRTDFKDQMTDEATAVVSIMSKNSTLFDFPYNQAGGSYLSLSFRKNGSELDAYLRISRGQMSCGIRDCAFTLRVGDGKVQRWTGLRSTTHDTDLMFVRDAKQLEAIVATGKPLRIGIEFFQAGERVFEFDPAGYPGI